MTGRIQFDMLTDVPDQNCRFTLLAFIALTVAQSYA